MWMNLALNPHNIVKVWTRSLKSIIYLTQLYESKNKQVLVKIPN